MTVTPSGFAGFFKDKHGTLVEAVPSFTKLQKRVPFTGGQEQLGRNYLFPVFLTRSHGVTWNGATATNGTAYTLNAAVSPVSQEATVLGQEFTLRDQVSYKALTSAAKKGQEAYDNLLMETTLQMTESARFYQEIAMRYGQGALGIGAVQGRATDSGTTQIFQITKASWAPGIWDQMLNGYVDVYATGFGTLRNAATIQVTAVDIANRLVTCLGTEAQMDNIVATDVFVPRGWLSATTPTYEVMAGLDKILANTTTLFGINPAVYGLWKAAQFSAGSAPATAGGIIGAVTQAAVRGLTKKCTVDLSVYAWTDIMNDLSALRRYVEKAGGAIEQGSTSVTLYGPNENLVELVPDPMMMAGLAHVTVDEEIRRIGSTDITFKVSEEQNEKMWVEMQDANGSQLRCYSDQAIIITKPAHCTRVSGIVNASLPDAATEV